MPRSTLKSAEIESKSEAMLASRETLSAPQAALKLGVASSTVKEMARAGELDAFKTPGGHWRISAAGIEEYRTGRRVGPRLLSAAPSGPLQNRRERVEDLNLQAQEIRARQQLSELQDEQASEADRRATEAQARKIERQRSLEQVRGERQRQKREQQQAEAEHRRAAIREQVLLALPQALAEAFPEGASYEQQRAFAEALDVELRRVGVEDMATARVVMKTLAVTFIRSWRAAAARDRLRKNASNRVSNEIRWMSGATPMDATEADSAIREAIARLPAEANEHELLSAARAAVSPIADRIESRERERMHRQELESVVRFSTVGEGFGDQEEAAQRAAREALETLPIGSDRRALERARDAALGPFREQVKARQAADRYAGNWLYVNACLQKLETDGDWEFDGMERLETAQRIQTRLLPVLAGRFLEKSLDPDDRDKVERFVTKFIDDYLEEHFD